MWKADTVTHLAGQERTVPEGVGEPNYKVHLIPEPRGLRTRGWMLRVEGGAV